MNAKLAKVRQGMVARFAADPTLAAAVVVPAPVRFSGGAIKGAKALGLAFDDDMGVSTDPAFVSLASRGLRAAVATVMPFEPGPETVGALAYRAGDDVRVFLYATRVDVSGAHGFCDYMVELPERAAMTRMGRVVVSVREIAPDGAFGAVSERCDGAEPGYLIPLDVPSDADRPDVLEMALRNLAQGISPTEPTNRERVDWTLRNAETCGTPGFPDRSSLPEVLTVGDLMGLR